MKLDRFIRIAIAAIIALLFIVAIAATLFVTESALNVWDRLVQGPRVLLYGYVAAMVALALAAVWLIWRLVVRRKAPRPRKASSTPLTEGDIRRRLEDAGKSGVDVADAQAELQELAVRQASGAIHLCFFGEISTGKSSLIKALVPAADITVDVLGGSTTDVQHYRWRDDEGHEILRL
jgi:membrane protein implicated in regulation of membrane protease activity